MNTSKLSTSIIKDNQNNYFFKGNQNKEKELLNYKINNNSYNNDLLTIIRYNSNIKKKLLKKKF